MQRYNDLLLQYFYHTPHQGRLDVNLHNVYTTTVGTTDNQDVFQLFLQISDNKIEQCAFLATGSVAIIAGGEWLCDHVAQKAVSEIKQLTVETILQNLALPTTKIHIANLLYRALKQCMDDYA